MAFISMVFVLFIIIIIIFGFISLIAGIILDHIWRVRKKKEKKVYLVHKIFAIFFTIIGTICFFVPILSIVGLKMSYEHKEYLEVADIEKEKLVYVNENDEYWNEFDFCGEHFVKVDDIHPQDTHEHFKKEKIGAIMNNYNDKHHLIYNIDNTMGITILTLEYYSGAFVEKSEINKVVDYYENEAPLYAEVSFDLSKSIIDVGKINSEYTRKILNKISNSGSLHPEDNYGIASENNDGYIFFYSTDDLICMSIEFFETDKGMVVTYGERGLILDEDEADFIRTIIEKAK